MSQANATALLDLLKGQKRVAALAAVLAAVRGSECCEMIAMRD